MLNYYSSTLGREMTLALATILLVSLQSALATHGGPGMAAQWAVGLRSEGVTQNELEQRAQNIARQHGLLFKGPVKL